MFRIATAALRVPIQRPALQTLARLRPTAVIRIPAMSGAATAAAELEELTLKPKLPIVIETKGVPVHLYTYDIEESARNQLIALAESGAAIAFVAGMPDVHAGAGTCVGSVFASDRWVCPAAVGVDIGCGMCAVPLILPDKSGSGPPRPLKAADLSLKKLLKIQALIKATIPTGFNQHHEASERATHVLQEITAAHPPSDWLAAQLRTADKPGLQLGSLGGGNHFLEVLKDGDSSVWIMLHSGSRNIGNVIATHWEGIAADETKARKAADPSSPGGQGVNLLQIESPTGRAYIRDMQWAQAYAYENRRMMLNAMADAVRDAVGTEMDTDRIVQNHHNFLSRETHPVLDASTGSLVDTEVFVTRKGATPAFPGLPGLIPGSMGTGSFVVCGKGEPRSWCSCSHGAGRRMSRSAAFASIRQVDFEKSMEGIVCDTVEDVRDEAPAAYKDLSTVMANQADLVEITHRLLPLLNVKGIEKSRQLEKKAKQAAKAKAKGDQSTARGRPMYGKGERAYDLALDEEEEDEEERHQ